MSISSNDSMLLIWYILQVWLIIYEFSIFKIRNIQPKSNENQISIIYLFTFKNHFE